MRCPSTFAELIGKISAIPPSSRPAARDQARAAFNSSPRRLSSCDRAVLDRILARLNWKRGYCETTWNQLAKETRFTRRHVIRCVTALEREGLVAILETRRPDGLSEPNRFCIPSLVTRMSPPSDADVTTPGDIEDTTGGDADVTEKRTREVLTREDDVRSGAVRLVTTPAAASEDTAFDEFWRAYPRHVAKQAAARSFAKLSRSDQAHAISATHAFSRELKRAGTEERFIPHAATFINQRRFEDYPQFHVGAPPNGTDNFSREAQLTLARRFLQVGLWDKDLGPAPGSPGCVVSEEIYAEVRAAHRPRTDSRDAGVGRHLN